MSGAERQRRHRDRLRAGRRVLRIEVDEAELADVLVAVGLLDPLVADMPDRLRDAVERHLSQLKAVTLDDA